MKTEPQKKLKAVHIDDEKDSRFLLKNALEIHFSDKIELIGEADSYQSGVELLKNQTTDIVFLDIQMSDGTGFDVLRQLEEHPFSVIFITSHDRFAIKAFEFSAIGYLLKPFDVEELRKVIDKIWQTTISKNEATKDPNFIKILIENYNSEQIRKIVIPHSDGFSVVKLEEIIFINSDRNYSVFNTTQTPSKITTSKTLIIYEKLLTEYGFFRVHQSYLVNMAHIQAYIRSEGGVLKMSNDQLIPVARQKKSELMERFL